VDERLKKLEKLIERARAKRADEVLRKRQKAYAAAKRRRKDDSPRG
jgi:hypothetical protein